MYRKTTAFLTSYTTESERYDIDILMRVVDSDGIVMHEVSNIIGVMPWDEWYLIAPSGRSTPRRPLDLNRMLRVVSGTCAALKLGELQVFPWEGVKEKEKQASSVLRSFFFSLTF